MQTFTLRGLNFPIGTTQWSYKVYDPVAGQWSNNGQWSNSITVNDPFVFWLSGLNGVWFYFMCWGANNQQTGSFGSYNLTDGANYTIDVQTGALGTSSGPMALIWQTPGGIPAEVKAGTLVVVNVVLKNTGTAAGVLSSGIVNSNPTVGWDCGFTASVAPGDTGSVILTFTMPNQTVSFAMIAMHRDLSSGSWITDQVQDYITINVLPSGTGPAHPILVSVPYVPVNASLGDLISLPLNIRNDGGSWGAIQARIRSSNINSYNQEPYWLDLNAYPVNGYEGIQTLSFVMPDGNVTFYIELYHWNYDIGQWIKDSESGPYSITNTGQQYQVNLLDAVFA